MDKVKKEFTLKDFFDVFQRFKKSIIIVTVTAGVIMGLLVFFVIDPIFLSIGVVKTTSENSGLAGLLGGGVPELGDFEDLAGGGSSGKELALYETILLSRRVAEETIIRFNLNDEWDYKFMQDAVKNFRKEVIHIYKDKVSGTMEIGAYDKDPVRAKEISVFLIDRLNKINIELSVQNAKNNREFIQERLETVKSDLRAVEDSLKNFQQVYGISPDLQISAATKVEIELETQIKSEEIKLDLLRKILSPGESEIKIQEEKIQALSEQLNDIKNSPDYSSSKLNLKGSPDVLMNFLRLKRNVEIQNKILSFVIPLYEQAKIDEKKEMPSVLIVDPPYIPERKEKPKRMVTIFIFMVLTGSVTYTFFFVKTILKEKYGIGSKKNDV